MDNKAKIYFKVLFFILLSLFLIAGCFFVLDIISRKSNDFNVAESKARNITDDVKVINEFKLKHPDYESDFKKIDELFVNSNDPLPLIEYLEGLSDASFVKAEISAPVFSQSGSLKVATVQIAVSGKFDDVISFVKSVENGKYFIRIKSISIETYKEAAKNKEAKQSVAKVSLAIEIFAR